jgi:demethylspheroidene O-methyltransferase
MTPRALLSLLFHADKALDLIATARKLGVLPRLDAGPVTLRALAEMIGARPLRLYKFLDGLESLGLIHRHQPSDDVLEAEYTSCEPLVPVIDAVLGERSIERDRDTYPWREIHGRLSDVIAGKLDARFHWPPQTAAEIRGFEASMAAGCPPIVEALRAARNDIFGAATRWLDVGGGDGTVAAALASPQLRADVYNLPATAPLVKPGVGFVAGDFLAEPLPRGYDVMSFIRVLHDWPADVARMLIGKAKAALAPGARLVITEEFRTPDRLAIQLFWTYFLIGVDACQSRLREVTWYQDALAGAGFMDVRVISGAFDIIVAVRGG